MLLLYIHHALSICNYKRQIIVLLGHEIKKPCFKGRQTFQVGSVGWDTFFFFQYFFFLSNGKNDYS